MNKGASSICVLDFNNINKVISNSFTQTPFCRTLILNTSSLSDALGTLQSST